MKQYERALFIFRRDLRISDNTGFAAALEHAQAVYPCFFFNDQQTQPHQYRSTNGLAFLLEALEDLSLQLSGLGAQLFLLHAGSEALIRQFHASANIDAVFVNKDYTPFSRARDKGIATVCEQLDIAFHSFSDALLVEPSQFGKPDGKPYTVFTPFYKRALQQNIKPVLPALDARIRERCAISTLPAPLQQHQTTLQRYHDLLRAPFLPASHRRSHGRRKEATDILTRIASFADYQERRDYPALDGTTILSPHNKFGTVSIREVYWAVAQCFGAQSSLIRELFWRDFFTHIAWHFPHVFQGAFQRQYDGLEWHDHEEWFQAWSTGHTGFPIIDAGMRELVATGYMHNRVRMIVASFLVKDLHIDWHRGEQFFAEHLTEFDPAVNNGSWQWAASTGCDAQPYFRVFNPWLQQEKFDKDAVYIKKWVPELRDISPKQLHQLDEQPAPRSTGYPMPIVIHSEQKSYALEMFKALGDKVKS